MISLLLVWALVLLGVLALFGTVGYGLYVALVSGNICVIAVTIIAAGFLAVMAATSGGGIFSSIFEEIDDTLYGDNDD